MLVAVGIYHTPFIVLFYSSNSIAQRKYRLNFGVITSWPVCQ